MFLALLLASGAAHAAIDLIDDQGQAVHLAQPAKRIVSLAPHITEMLFAAGAGDRVVGAVRSPLRLAHASVGQLPAALAKNVVIVHAEAVVAPAIETHEAKLRVLLPVPVRGQMREAAPARLVFAQGLLQRDVLGDIGKGAHVATVFQHVCAYLQPAPRAGQAAAGAAGRRTAGDPLQEP